MLRKEGVVELVIHACFKKKNYFLFSFSLRMRKMKPFTLLILHSFEIRKEEDVAANIKNVEKKRPRSPKHSVHM